MFLNSIFIIKFHSSKNLYIVTSTQTVSYRGFVNNLNEMLISMERKLLPRLFSIHKLQA